MFQGMMPVFDRKEPLYRQVHQWLAELIIDGTFTEGCRLPPTRKLAVCLGVARQVAIAAYEELYVDGRMSGHVGRRTFVIGSNR